MILQSLVSLLFMNPNLQAQNSCEQALKSNFPADVSAWVAGTQTPGHFKKSMDRMEFELQTKLQNILRLKSEKRTFENTVLATDAILDRFSAEGLTLHTVAQLIPTTPETEAEITDFNTRYYSGLNKLVVNAELYQAIASTEVAAGEEAELKAALIRKFEETGATLPAETRTKISELVAERAGLSSAYRLDLQNDPSSVTLDVSDLAGVPADLYEDYLKDGKVILPVKSPALVTSILAVATVEETRKQIYLAYRSRLPQNMDRLLKITHINNEIAKLQGKGSHLENAVSLRSLAGGPAEVEKLLLNLGAGVKVGLQNRFGQMADLKNAEGSNLPLKPWDHYYYEAKLAAQELKSAPDVGQYFYGKSFLKPFFATLNQMFEINFVEIKGEPVWHPSVKLFRIDNAVSGEPVGYMYMDVYSREVGKPESTAFVEEFVSRRRDEKRLPVMIFVQNWGKESDELKVSIGEAQTALHEMGHALHGLIQQAPYFSVSGWTHPQDMMEVPSTTLDRMIKEPEMIQSLSALNGDLNQKMPIELAREVADSMKGFKVLDGDFHSGSHEMNTVFLSTLDIAIQKEADSLKSGDDILAIYRKEFEKFYGFAPPPEDQFPQTFHHIAGEYAGYYASYIVAGVNAANNVDRLKELGGILNPAAIRTWKTEALEVPQYLRVSSDIQKNFWKRDISVAPIFKEQGFPLPTE